MSEREIIWLASYPKSGNTWLRFFLYSYYFGIPRKSGDVNLKIPDIHSSPERIDASRGRHFCKTHFLASPAHPYMESTAGIIYLMRHPKDVLLSNLNYFYLTGHFGLDAARFAKEFIRQKGVPYWKSIGMGTWDEHVHSWLESDAPRLVLRYEELRRNPREQFTRVIEFLGDSVDSNQLEKALNRAGIENMRRLENAEKKRKIYSPVFWGNSSATSKGLRFINKGAVNQSLSQIDESLDSLFDEAFASELRELGYA